MNCNLPFEAVANAFPEAATDISMLQIIESAERLGLHAKGVRIADRNLSTISCPSILFVNNDHFLVFSRCVGEKIEIIDYPFHSNLCTQKEINENWCGEAILFQDEVRVTPEMFGKSCLYFPNKVVDFRLADENIQLERSFPFVNMSSDVAIIHSVTASSDQICVAPSCRRIPPKEYGGIEAAFQTGTQYGRRTYTIGITYAGQATKAVFFEELTLTGLVTKKVIWTPKELDFGIVRYRDNVTRSITILAQGEEKSKCRLEFFSEEETVQCTVVQEEGDSSRSLQRFEVDVVLQGRNPGLCEGSLVITSPDSEVIKIEIPIVARVVGPIHVTPSLFFYGFIGEGDSVRRSVVLSTSDEETMGFSVLNVASQNSSLSVIDWQKESEGTWIITTQFKPWRLGLFDSSLDIETDHRVQPRIRIKAIAMCLERTPYILGTGRAEQRGDL